MKYWICVTNEANWIVVKTSKIWGVSDRHKEKIVMTREGDKLMFYVKPMRIGGIFEVVSKPFRANTMIFESGAYPHRIKLNPVIIPKKFLEFRPLIDELRFITQKKMWGGHLQGKAMILIDKKDFELIEEKIK